MDRLRGYLRERGYFEVSQIEAVLAVLNRPPALRRCRARRRCARLRRWPRPTDLAAANKRVHNIMRKNPRKNWVRRWRTPCSIPR